VNIVRERNATVGNSDSTRMWINVITGLMSGLFAIGGIVTGVLMEPWKGLIAARTRNRQQRSEQAALVIRNASDSRHLVVELNAVYRVTKAGGRVSTEQQNELITRVNTVRDDIRKAAALLRLHGPDELADQADVVRAKDLALFSLIHETEDGEHAPAESPKRVQQAAEAVDDAVKTFAELARKHTT
jgi:hypothetical protein